MFSLFVLVGLAAALAEPLPGLALAAAALAFAVPGWLNLQELRGGVAGLRSRSEPESALEFAGSILRALVLLYALLVYSALFVALVTAFSVGAGAEPVPAALVVSGVVLAFVVAMLLVLARRGTLRGPGIPYVRLTPDALVVRGLVSLNRLSWQESPWVLPHRQLRLDLRVSRPDPSRRGGVHASLPGGLYRSSRLAIAAAIGFYAAEPHLRSELGTLVAEERVRRENLPPAFPG